MSLKPSDYVGRIKRKAKDVLDNSATETNRYNIAATKFFEKMKLGCKPASAGDKCFLANNYQEAIKSAFEYLGFVVEFSPKIDLKSNLINKKLFDILISNHNNDKHILIELKSTTGGFNGLAAALLSIMIATKKGVTFTSKNNNNLIKLNKTKTKFILMIGKAYNNDTDKFDELSKIFLPRIKLLESYSIYSNRIDKNDTIFKNMAKFIRKQSDFLLLD